MYSLKHYINIIKNANSKKQFKVVYLNFHLNDDLKPDCNPIEKVYDFKQFYNKYVKSKLEHCSDVRIVKFIKNKCEISLSLDENKYLPLTLLKKALNGRY